MKSKIIIILCFVFFLQGCKQMKQIPHKYPQHIGDTEFISEIDNPNFKFCNPSNVLHSRSRVYFKGGQRGFEEKIIKNYNFDTSFEKFTGYFIVRFAVNCKNETGRFRWEIVDSNFNKTDCSKKLEKHIITILKNLKGWQHPVIDGKNYDGYNFIVIKLIKGKIIRP